jgi:hypothetical protein
MPQHDTFLFQVVHQGIIHVSVAIGTGEDYYAKFHGSKDSLKKVVENSNDILKHGRQVCSDWMVDPMFYTDHSK